MVAYIVVDHFGTYQTCNLSTRNLIEFITVPVPDFLAFLAKCLSIYHLRLVKL